MSRSHKIAWAAGFMDGDGFITIQNRTSKYKDKVYTGHYLRVGACQSALAPLEELKKLFGGSVRPKHVGGRSDGYNRKPQWVWSLSTAQANEALKEMLPFLLHKRQVALLALEFQGTMGTDKSAVKDEVYEKRKEIQTAITAINSQS